MVEHVEEFCGEGHAAALRDQGLLGDTQVQVPGSETANSAAARTVVYAELNRSKLVAHSLWVSKDVQPSSSSAGAGTATAGRSSFVTAGAGASATNPNRLRRSEERRVGKEGR